MSTDVPAEHSDVPDDLIRAACVGDEQAFGEVFRALYPRVHRTVWAMLGSESEAHDVAQEAWVKAWKNRKRYNFQSQYTTWIHRIAVNTALDALRKRKRWRAKFVSMFSEMGESLSVNKTGPEAVQSLQETASPSGEANPARVLDNSELGQRIQSAVDKLPEAQRTVLVLREYEGYSYEEIASALKIEAGTVMSRLYHARKKLQTSLSKELS
ncbi:MAG: RNA polymerase sigma factor [Opitutales bacterium]